MNFGELVEYVTESGIHNIPLGAHDLLNKITLDAIRRDYDKVSIFGRNPILTSDELSSVQDTAPYNQDVIENEIVGTDPVQIIDNLIAVRARPDWIPWIAAAKDDVYFYVDNLYTVIQAHTTQPDWTPDVTPALWKRFYEPEAGPQPWVQPTGAHDAYQIGDRVTHNGQVWESIAANNVWAPGVYGWVVVP